MKIFLLNKERSANNNNGDTFASKLPAFCSELPGDTLSARFSYLTEASQKLPEGKTESERNAVTLLQKAPAPAKKRKALGQCGAPPAKTARFSLSPQDFVNCVQNFMAATLSKSSESIEPIHVAEDVLTRYYKKVSGPKENLTNTKSASNPKVVEPPQPAHEIEVNVESELNPKPSSSSKSVEPTVAPGPSGQSSRQKGKGFTASSHKSIVSKEPLPKPSYKEQKSKKSSYEYSPRSFRCGSRIGPGLYCDQLMEPWHKSCMACEKRLGGNYHNTRSGRGGGHRGGPPRGGPRGGHRGGRGGRRGNHGSGRGQGIAA